MTDIVVILGHSHVFALRDAWAADPGLADGAEPVFLPLNGPAFDPPLGPGGLHRGLERMLTARRVAAVVLALGGNRHNALGLSPGPVPFDTVLPDRPDLPLAAGATLVPFAALQATLARRSPEIAPLMAAIRAATRVPMVQIDAPPPIPSEAHLRAHAGVFAPMFRRHGVAPATVRYKLWRANGMMMAGLCARHGLGFVPAPPEMQDADGMLAPGAWRDDATHAGPAYGAAVLRQIAGLRRAGDAAWAPAA